MTEQHLTLGIGKGARTERNRQAAQALADRELAPAIAEVALGLHLAHLQPGRIFDRRQVLGEGDRTGAIAAGRSGQPERVMWAQQVVAVAKAVELALAMVEVGEVEVAQKFEPQGAMEAFIFALGLGM